MYIFYLSVTNRKPEKVDQYIREIKFYNIFNEVILYQFKDIHNNNISLA